MLRKTVLGAAVLASIAAMSTIHVGCFLMPARSAGQPAAMSPEEQERQEAAGQDDLRKAKGANTEQAYRLVMKRHPDTRAYHQAASIIAGMRADEAKQALARGERDKARALAEEALKTGDGEVIGRAKAVLEQMQLEDADKVIKATAEILQAGNTPETCAKAVATVAEALGDSPPPVLERETRAKTSQPLTACLQALTDGADAIDDAGKTDAYAAMRKLIDAPATRRALGNDPARVLLTALEQAAGQAMQAATRADLKSKNWESASATIRKWRDSGAVSGKQADAASQSLRDSLTKDLIDRSKAALGQNGAEPVLADIERGLKLLGNGAPPELKALQGHLATWIECKRLTCKPTPKPKPMYAFGAVAVFPLDAPKGQAADTVPNATRFWVLASGGGFGLVAREDPGEAKSWADKLAAARGWIAESALQAEDTSNWLPVGKALEGTRVWLPTDKGDGLYLLGSVQTVSGNDVTVKRMADGQAVTVKRDILRTGNMRPGLKVLAFCTGNLSPSPARFEEVVPTMTGNPIARVTCLTPDGKDDKSRNEVIGSLRSKPEWLPPRRP